MPAALAIVLSLLAAPPERDPVKLAAPGFSGVDVTEAQATFFSDHLAQQLNLHGLQVTTGSQIGTLLGFERQRQLLSCKEAQGSCMAELAAALGVDGVVTGSVGKFDNTFQVNISVVSSRDGRTLSAFSRKVNGGSAVLDALNDAADQLARDLPRALGRSLAPPAHQPNLRPEPEPAPLAAPPPPAASSGGLRGWSWIPAAAGVASGAGATVMLLMAKNDADQLEYAIGHPTPPLSLDKAQLLQNEGRMYSTLGYALTAVGVAGLGVGAYFFFGTSPASQPVAVRISPGPTGVVVSGNFR